jgi:hypothetical protein
MTTSKRSTHPHSHKNAMTACLRTVVIKTRDEQSKGALKILSDVWAAEEALLPRPSQPTAHSSAIVIRLIIDNRSSV